MEHTVDNDTYTVEDHDLDSCIPEGWGKSSRGKSITIEPHPKIMDELADFLAARNHTCVCIVGAKNHQFKWCEKDVCPKIEMREAATKRDEELHQLIEKLQKEGHTCIAIGDRYPISVGWCNKEVCIYKQPKIL